MRFKSTQNIMNFLILLFALLTSFAVSIAHAETKHKNFDSYKIKFDYEKYPKEREIVYSFHLEQKQNYIQNLTKASFGIELFDIDGDGKKEILVYINAGDVCSQIGCPFFMLKQKEGSKDYKYIQLGLIKNNYTKLAKVNDLPKILSSKSNGYHDLLFDVNTSKETIWSWNGKYYNIKEGYLEAYELSRKYEGYNLNFSADKSKAEKEIAHRYFLDVVGKEYSLKPGEEYDEEYTQEEQIEKIAIDMFDIDGDGKKEIFANMGTCADFDACGHAILKPVVSSDKNKKPYTLVTDGPSFLGYNTIILSTKHNGMYDILENRQDEEDHISLYNWDGVEYKYHASFQNASAAIRKFEGYLINYDYTKYPEERELAYQWYLDKISHYIPNIPKEKIGIDLYDIDNDGKREIFAFIDGGDLCPHAGCPVVTIRAIDMKEKRYASIPYSSLGGDNSSGDKDTMMRILNSTTNGYHDFIVGEESKNYAIWKWNGLYYELDKIYE